MQFPSFVRLGVVPMLKKNTATQTMESFTRKVDFLMADLYSTALNFSYELISDKEGNFGSILPNGSFNGVIGMLVREEADIAISALGITEKRLEVVKYSFPYFIDAYTFATKTPDFAPKFLTIVYPFSAKVWLSIFSCLVVMSAVFYFVLRRKYSFIVVLLKTFGSLLNQSPPIIPRFLRDRLLFIGWSSGVMFITYSYMAVLLSFLTLPARERGIRTMSDLANGISEGKYEGATYRGSFVPDVLLKSNDETLTIIGNNVKQNLVLPTDTEMLILHPTKKIALLSPKSYVWYLKNIAFISEDNFYMTLYALPYRKSFCCGQSLETATHRIVSAGLHKKVLGDESFKASLSVTVPSSESEYHRKLTLVDMSGAFSFLIIGYILSIFAFIFELITVKLR